MENSIDSVSENANQNTLNGQKKSKKPGKENRKAD
jgi:hypothetical protein